MIERMLSIEYEKSVFERAYEKAVEIIKNRPDIQNKSFDKFTTKEKRQEHTKHIDELDAKFVDKEPTKDEKYGVVLEAFIYDRIASGDWIEGVEAWLTTKHDDYVNKVDMLLKIELEEMKDFLGLAIDATVSSNSGSKFNYILRQLEQGKLSKVEYPNPDWVNEKLINMPLVVVGVERRKLEAVLEAWVNNEEDIDDREICSLVFDEVLCQLNLYKDFFDKKKNDLLRDRFSNLDAIIYNMTDESSVDDNVKNGIEFQVTSMRRRLGLKLNNQ